MARRPLRSIEARLQERGEQVRYIAAGLDFADPAFGDPRLFLLRLGDLFAGSGGTVLIDEARWHRRSGSMLAQSFSAEAIKYWRSTGGAEIDFIVSLDTGCMPVEVKFTGTTPTEPVAMRNFRSTYPDARLGIIITRDTASAPQSPTTPMLVPAYLVDFVDWHRL